MNSYYNCQYFLLLKDHSIKLLSAGLTCIFLLSGLTSCKSDAASEKLPSDSTAQSIAVTEDFYQEITKDAGLNFVHSIGAAEMENIVESVGGGAAFIDYDQDGYMDVFTCNGTCSEKQRTTSCFTIGLFI